MLESVPSRVRVADLFCGASGFGLGARTAGLNVVASVDVDPILTSSYSLNFNSDRLLLADVAKLSGRDLIRFSGGRVDGIIGGPPCQGFSEAGRNAIDDPRRELLDHFFRIVAEVQPRFFVMENVRGLMFDKNRMVLEVALARVSSSYEILGPVRIDAHEFGAATKRPRVFVFGVDRRYSDPFTAGDLESLKVPSASVRDAIGDLPYAKPDGLEDGFDVWRFGSDGIYPSSYAKRLRSPDGYTTGHRKTPHKEEIVARFSAVPEGGVDGVGRHKRLSWSGLCPTLRAGTGSDKGSFQAVRPLHPEESRVITVREAARLQGFPDTFRFHPTVWHSFRMIGNSVCPIVAQALLKSLASKSAKGSIPEAAE